MWTAASTTPGSRRPRPTLPSTPGRPGGSPPTGRKSRPCTPCTIRFPTIPFPRPWAVALILVGGAGGWWLHGLQGDQGPAVAGLADRAARAYTVFTPEVLHPVEVTAENEAHLVKWLSKRLGAPLRAPALSGLGYELVGGRLLADRRGPAALFVYENQEGERLTVYVRRAAAGKETAFRYTYKDRVGVFYWIDGPLAYAIAGEIEKPRLLEVANAIYRQLNP